MVDSARSEPDLSDGTISIWNFPVSGKFFGYDARKLMIQTIGDIFQILIENVRLESIFKIHGIFSVK